jgi:hypothetical protein
MGSGVSAAAPAAEIRHNHRLSRKLPEQVWINKPVDPPQQFPA